MVDEDVLPKPPKKPPDFSSWKLVDKVSAHVYPGNRYQPKWHAAEPGDERMDSWMILVYNYTKDVPFLTEEKKALTSTVVGVEYHFFGKECHLKYWGLQDDKGDTGKESPLHSFAYRRPNGIWEVFSNIEYEANYEPVFGIKQEDKKVIAVLLSVKRRKEKGPLPDLNQTIKR